MKEWIDYNGKECGGVQPVPSDALVFVRFRNGEEETSPSSADCWSWHALDNGYDVVAYAVAGKKEESPTKTGGSTPNQYRISLNLPTTEDRTKFVQVDLEAMDVIDALDLSGNLKDVQKALFRLDKKADVSVQYDLTKSVFYLVRELKKRGYISHAEFWEISDYISKALKGD